MTEAANKHFAAFVMLWDIIKMSIICQKPKHFSAGIMCATVSLGVMYFVRKYRGNALKKIKEVSACGDDTLPDKVVVVNSLRECQIVARTLQRLVVCCRTDQLLYVYFHSYFTDIV
jgi:hypothetical protein